MSKSLLVNAKVSVLQIAHQLEAPNTDAVQLDSLWAKLEDIKQALCSRVRLIEARERDSKISQ